MDSHLLFNSCLSDYYDGYGPERYSHRLDIFTNVSNKNMFVITNKCGCHTLFDVLPNHGYSLSVVFQHILDLSLSNNFILSKNNGYNKIFFIREPKERYISGLMEYINIQKKNGRFDIIKIIDQLSQGKIVLDAHTLPQYFNSIPYLNDKNLLIYRFNEFANRIKSTDKNINHIPVVNSKNFDDKEYGKWLFNNFVDPELFNKVYKEDFELYKKSK